MLREAQAQGVCASELVPGHLPNEEVEARHGRLYGHAKKVVHRARTVRHSGGALGPDLALCRRGCFAWQAWHLVTSTLVSCGRRGTWRHLSSLCVAGVALTALGWVLWRAWSGSGALSPRLFCVAGVALGDIHLRFTWQAWHLATAIVTLRGRRGTYGTGLGAVARLVRIWRSVAAAVLRGRRGTW